MSNLSRKNIQLSRLLKRQDLGDFVVLYCIITLIALNFTRLNLLQIFSTAEEQIFDISLNSCGSEWPYCSNFRGFNLPAHEGIQHWVGKPAPHSLSLSGGCYCFIGFPESSQSDDFNLKSLLENLSHLRRVAFSQRQSDALTVSDITHRLGQATLLQACEEEEEVMMQNQDEAWTPGPALWDSLLIIHDTRFFHYEITLAVCPHRDDLKLTLHSASSKNTYGREVKTICFECLFLFFFHPKWLGIDPVCVIPHETSIPHKTLLSFPAFLINKVA